MSDYDSGGLSAADNAYLGYLHTQALGRECNDLEARVRTLEAQLAEAHSALESALSVGEFVRGQIERVLDAARGEEPAG